MSIRFTVVGKRNQEIRAIVGVLAIAVSLSCPAVANDLQIPPQTKLRLTVMQWIPTKGEYEKWEALGGDVTVSESGSVVLPVIGPIPVGDLDGEGLSAEIATRLKEKMGLVSKPETRVEILNFPPVYVVGDVAKPGEFEFRPGLTVLQAFALSGGEWRSAERESAGGEAKLLGQLKGLDNELLRCKVRIARLHAEMLDAAEIDLPISLGGTSPKLAADIFAQEKVIFAARANKIGRQKKSLLELRDFLAAQLDVMQERVNATDASIKSAEDELVGVSALVDKGIALASRRTDLERILAGYRTERMSLVTDMMKTRQSISEATRSLDGLMDDRRTEIASQLQDEQAKRDHLELQQSVFQKVLFDVLSSDSSKPEEKSVSFMITRLENGQIQEVAAQENTPLSPRDVVRVAVISSHTQSPDQASSARIEDADTADETAAPSRRSDIAEPGADASNAMVLR